MDCKIAIIEFGDNQKVDIVLIHKVSEKAINQPDNLYYYPNNITL